MFQYTILIDLYIVINKVIESFKYIYISLCIVSEMKIRLELEIVREPIKGLQKLCINCGLCM